MFLKKISLNYHKFSQNLCVNQCLYKKCSIYNIQTMSTDSNLLKPPPQVAGLKTLNKTLFDKNITVPCLIVRDKKVSSVLPFIKKYLLKIDHFKPVRNISENEAHIYLNPELVNAFKDLPSDVQNSLNELKITTESKLHTLTYDNYSIESIFRAVLPKDIEGMSSFTKVGHIVHVNLREHLIPFKEIIGQVLFDKVPNCRTVVNKVNIIDNTYRNFQMEILRGDNDMVTKVKENKCTFEFDFSKVYWNSRLCTEHERIVNMIKSDDVVFDVFAGVGPFSVPLAKKKCRVFANDLNPESFKWLNHNFKINKVDKNYFETFNKDGNEFILNEIKEMLPKYINKNNVYILMNLPAMAVEFLTSFVNLYKNLEKIDRPPIVVVYCFAKGEDYVTIAKNLLFTNIGCDIEDKIIDIFRVRTVSSLKEMMRITFKLDEDILCGHLRLKRKIAVDSSEVESKKCIVVVMGKNKNKKLNSVFKVAGAKSLKFKAKAKPVKTELKHINVKNKEKIMEMDKELVNLQEKLRSTNQDGKKDKLTKSLNKLPQRDVNSEEVQKNSQETLAQLDALQL